MDTGRHRLTVTGLAVVCLFLELSCMESGAPDGPPATPGAPAKPTLAAPAVSTTGAYILRWSGSAGSATFVLEEDVTSDFVHPSIMYSGPDTTTRIIGKSEGVVYYYRVRGYNENGSGPWSDLVFVRVVSGPHPRLIVSPDTLNFGRVLIGQGQLMHLQISNIGSAALTVTGVAIDNPLYVLTTVLPVIVRPATSTDLDIRFTPQTAGLSTGTLTVFSNDEDDYPPEIPLIGEGGG